ncbi:MAG: hypothetical protein ILA34_01710 [Bacteroidaceae bacterium]|nr:hypothetical protein [Bacteroidaceae bacterium]
MNRKYRNLLVGCISGLILFTGIVACSDDHFDVKQGVGQNPTASLWDNILATHQCDSFALILQRTLVKKRDYGTPVTLTYDKLLKSSKIMTVWAPQDGSYNAQYWLNQLDNGKNELVEREFVANHIAYFNYNGSYPVVKRIMLANEKFATYDDSTAINTFNDIPISEEYKNVPSTNGTLHLLNGVSSFTSNLRELIEKYDELSSLYEYIESRDTIIFLESSSTPGTTINGEIHYVDSVFYEYNKMLPRIAENEDSICAAIFPSNAAWEEALERISKSYNYKNRYGYRENTDEGLSNMDTIKADSVSDARTKLAIFNNMFYSLYEQPGFDIKNASIESVGEFFRTCDSLQSTVYYSTTDLYHQHEPDCRQLTEGKDPIYKASNGYAFITDKFNFKAKDSWQYDITFDGENSWYVNRPATENTFNANPTGQTMYVTEGTRNPYISGVVRGDAYRSFTSATPQAATTVSYNIPNVCSGTYDIYVVLLPESMLDSLNTDNKYNSFTATVAYDFDEKGKATGTYTSPSSFVNDPTKVDTILLFENFKFPYAYYGLPVAKPYITLISEKLNSAAKRRIMTSTFNIDCFILKSKDE